jgi:trehalose-phosphatase
MEQTKNLYKLIDFKAIILDLDGVISKTAKVHARAWKKMFDEYLQYRKNNGKSEFRSMSIDKDYPRYIDGKPRYEGVKSFLKSRNIELDYGNPKDDPGKKTICGLGNRKNDIFRELIQNEGVDLYQDTVNEIRSLKKEGLRTGVVSSSKNCEMILEAGGISDLFDTRVDGIISAKLNLKGKPNPDIYLKAADDLNVKPSESIVVEDALAGVEAGHEGKFKLVIGIDRQHQKKQLLEHGADVVVKNLKEVKFNGNKSKHFKDIPSAIKLNSKIDDQLNGKDPVFFLDYDGTLTPIVKHPEDAVLSFEMRSELKELASLFKVAIISGRDLNDVKKLVNLNQLIYAGSHGFDISGPDNLRMQNPDGIECLPELDDAEETLKKNLSAVEHVEVERKKFAIAIHFRNVNEKHVDEIQSIVDEVRKNHPKLKKDFGKKIFELKPDIDWDKGRAILWLLDKIELASEKAVPVYIGDDLTDEDAFKSIQDKGIGILVGDHGKSTLASYKLESVQEVKKFFQWVIKKIGQQYE